MTQLRLGTAATLAALLLLAGCGGGDDDDTSATEGTPVAGEPTPLAGEPSVAPDAIPSAGATASKSPKPKKTKTPKPAPASTSVAAVPTPTPKSTPKLLYPTAMPDGRTAPQNGDFSFDNLKLDQRFFETIATVDVTYKGPGIADVSFSAAVSYTTEDGQKQSVQLSGIVSKLNSGEKRNVRLSGASNLPPRIKPGYSAKYTVSSTTDGDAAVSPAVGPASVAARVD